MSAAHILELDSQTDLLHRLAMLSNFSSNLIVVNGDVGFGKSWLAQRYLEIGATNKNQCLLLCHPNQDDTQRRMQILSQIVSDALFNQQDSLLDSMERILDSESCDIAIVVDDAHLLSEALISELWMLVLAAQSNPSWKINVILFSQLGRLENVLQRVSYGQELKPVELEIDMLSEMEARQFFESLVMRYVDDDNEKRTRAAFKTVSPIPGDIMALGDLKVEKRIIIRSIVGSPIKIAIVVLALLLLAAGGYWWMLNQPTPDDKAQQIAGTLEQTAIPTLSEPRDEETKKAENLTPLDHSVDPSLDVVGAQDDSDALPPAIVDEVASVGNEDTQQRVIIESDVVDALLEGKPETADTTEIKQVVESTSTQSEAPSGATSSALIEVIRPEATEEVNAPDSEVASPPIVQFSFAKEELKALSPRAYTLQLAAMTSLEDVQSFLDDYQLNDKVRIYPTVRSNTDWYIITYQDFPTIQQARDAVDDLPSSLKALSPWAKSLRQVQREIERVK
ncbi:AAA family ATPase [Vibrio rotiferianus]|uniref:AAA family ATPase n=1 Tax=Vibrio rotiferianus TaxID=190895 RepID=UPI00406A112C